MLKVKKLVYKRPVIPEIMMVTFEKYLNDTEALKSEITSLNDELGDLQKKNLILDGHIKRLKSGTETLILENNKLREKEKDLEAQIQTMRIGIKTSLNNFYGTGLLHVEPLKNPFNLSALFPAKQRKDEEMVVKSHLTLGDYTFQKLRFGNPKNMFTEFNSVNGLLTVSERAFIDLLRVVNDCGLSGDKFDVTHVKMTW